jgi:hypothetical protein
LCHLGRNSNRPIDKDRREVYYCLGKWVVAQTPGLTKPIQNRKKGAFFA